MPLVAYKVHVIFPRHDAYIQTELNYKSNWTEATKSDES